MKDKKWEFEMVSDHSSRSDIRVIDPELSKVNIQDGGLNWSFVENWTIFGSCLPFIWQRGLLARLRRNDYDAVIFLGSIHFISTWIGVIQARILEKRILFWTHGFLGNDGVFLSWIRHTFYRMADCNLLYGNRAKNIMLDSGIYQPNQLKVVYNSLDYESMERIRSTMTADDRQQLRQSLFGNVSVPIIVAIGRLNKVKRYDLLLKSLQLLKEEKVIFRCLIVGDGDELERLKKIAAELCLTDWIRFHGVAYGEAADRLLLASDLCVIPGDIGLSAMHAMSAGLPVISHNNYTRQMPEHEAIVEGKTGSFYEYESVSSLAKSIKGWLSNPSLLTNARDACLEQINSQFNVFYQVDIIKKALSER